MRGDLFEAELSSYHRTSAQPFKERFSNELAGWSTDISIEIPNGVSIC